MGLIIAGERSGVGKTTVTLALLAAIAQQNQLVQSFKVGPDYIDPMFHQAVTHRASYSLDPVLTSETYVRQCYERQAQTAECCLIEGVMGLFDGAAGAAGCDAPGSTAHIARILGLPVALVIDCSRLSNSVAAIAHGFSTFDPRLRLAGVILNRVGSDRHLDLLKAALSSLDLPILGVLRRRESVVLPDRHLGLVPAEEVGNFRAIVAELGTLGRRCFDWQQLTPLLKAQLKAQPERKRVTETSDFTTRIHPTARPAIAIARDSAFNFYYPDNLDQLAALGAELVAWSPMADAALPAGCQGLYLGGGFPEVFAAELSQNKRARQSIRQAIAAGVPTYAECGGLMYLCQSLTDLAGATWPMVGSLPTQAVMDDVLTLGYRRAIAQQSTPLLAAGAVVRGHEFHRSRLTTAPSQPIYALGSLNAPSLDRLEGWKIHNLHASYLHLQWGERLEMPRNFVAACARQKPLN